MARTSCKVVVVATLAGVLAAQNDTAPAFLNGREGGTGTAIPFGVAGAARVQYIYDAEDLPWTGPRLVTRVSFRADNTTDTSTTFPSKGFVFVTLLLSTTSARAESASTVFEDNYGTDVVYAVTNQPMMLPAQPAWTGARPANIDFVLAAPWFYGLTPVRGDGPPINSLLVELRIHSQPTGTYRLDNTGSCSIPVVAVGNVGPACAPVGGQNVELLAPTSVQAGSNASWSIDRAEPNAFVVLMFGIDPQTAIGGNSALALPVPLFDTSNPLLPHPLLASLAPTLFTYGAPDCYLNVDPTGLLFGATDTAGQANIQLAVPQSHSIVGMPIYSQVAAHSFSANALQLVTSRGWRSTICGPLGVARIYALGSDTATSGQYGFGQGAVIELH